jgi:AbiV family abortive infection protein
VYLLAHFACEELGKIPIVVGVVGRLLKDEAVDCRAAMKRFRDHKAKIDSDDFHHYVFGIELDLLRGTDLKWLEEARAMSADRVNLKNNSTYVDIRGTNVISPLDKITEDHAKEMLQRALSSLRAHWHAECLTNPVVIAANGALGAGTPTAEQSGRP